MTSTVVLTWKEDGLFNRTKLQLLYPYQRPPINNLLDRVEVVYAKMLPKSSKKIWIVYFILLTMFICSGIWKHHQRRPPPSPPQTGHNARGRSLAMNLDSASKRKLQGQNNRNNNDCPDPNAKGDGSHATDEELQSIRDRREGPLFHLRNISFFVLELFFLGYPFYYILSKKRQIRDTNELVRDLVDIESRQLIVNYRLKVEVTKLSAFTVIQLESEGSTGLLDKSMAPLVQPRQTKGRRVRQPTNDVSTIV